MKHESEILETLLGRIEVEKLSIASSCARLNELYSEIEDLAYARDQAHCDLVEATEAIRNAIEILNKEV